MCGTDLHFPEKALLYRKDRVRKAKRACPYVRAGTSRTEVAAVSENDKRTREDEKEASCRRRAGDDTDSLRQYYRQLSGSEPLTAEEESVLWQKMDEERDSIRRGLYRLGFVLPEHVKLFHCLTPESLGEVFTADKDASLFPLLKGWVDEIEWHYEKQRAAFFEGDRQKLEECREQAVDLLLRYPVSPDKLYEWFRVASMYRSSLDDPETSFAETEEKLLYRKEDFEELLDRISECFERLEELRQRLLTANLRLVVSIVKPFRCESVQTGDLIQEGNLGLIKALERFDHRLGHKFSTYATWWIRQAVSKAIAAQSRIIRLPAHMLASISRINRAERIFIQKHGREPEVGELAAALEMPRERVNAIRRMASQAISLQAPVSEDLDSPAFEQYLSTEEGDSPSNRLAFQFLQDRLNQALGKLTEQEQLIITLHFGLSGKKPMTLVELSELCGLTRERIRQIEARALKKLKDPSFTLDFQDYFS